MPIKRRRNASNNELIALLFDMWKNRGIVVLSVFFFGILGVFIALWMRPVYEANALVSVKSKSGGLSTMLGGMESLLLGGSAAATEIELIGSRRVLETAIERIGYRNKIEPINFLDRLLHREGRVRFISLQMPDTSVILPKKRRKEPWRLTFSDSIHYTVSDDLKREILKGKLGESYAIPYDGDSLKIALDTLSTVAPGQRFEFSQSFMPSAVESFRKILEIGEQGKKTGLIIVTGQANYQDDACDLVNAVVDEYLKLNAEFSMQDAEKMLEVLAVQMDSVKQRLDSSFQSLNDYRNKIGSASIEAETQIALETRTRLQQQILLLNQQREERIRLFDASHPNIRTLDEQIANMQKELSRTGREVKKLPNQQQEILILSAEVQKNQTMYTQLFAQAEKLKLLADANNAAQLIDSAEAAVKPIKPKKKIILLAFLFLGFCAAAAIVSIKKKFRGGETNPLELSLSTGKNVYAKLPLYKKDVIREMSADKAFRAIAASYSLILSEDKKIISVLGITPRAGASAVAENLARAFAESGKKTLLVDADLQKGIAAEHFSIDSRGLSEYILGAISFESALQETSVKNLTVLAAGETPVNPAELFASREFKALTEKLREHYEVILFDSPAWSAPESFDIVEHADSALFILQYAKESTESILAVTDSLAEKHCALIINKARTQKSNEKG